MLKAEGLTIVGEAADVGEGLAAARKLRPDAALVDVRLPDGDGIALACELARFHGRRVSLSSRARRACADAERPGPNGTQLPFMAKEDLPNARLHELLWGE